MRTSVLIPLLLVFAPIALASAAFAQPLPQTVASSRLTQAQEQEMNRRIAVLRGRINVLATETALQEQAVCNIAMEIFGAQPNLEFEAYATLIADGARELRNYIANARSRTDPDPAANALRLRAISAAEDGRLSEARGLYDELIAANRAARQRARDAEDLVDAADLAESARLAFISADFRAAAQRYAEAAELAPESARTERIAYRRAQGQALEILGDRFGDLADIRAAIDVFERQLLPLTPRDSSADEWGVTQTDIGNAFYTLGQRGDTAALDRALQAYRDALSVRSREADPVDWARSQINLGNVLEVRGSRGLGAENGLAALREARAAYEAALGVLTREAQPRLWSDAQGELGAILTAMGMRGDREALTASLPAYEASLTVKTREGAPESWAATRLNMGNAYEMLSHGVTPEESRRLLERAIAAYDDAVLVWTQADNPVGWALAQMEVGVSLLTLAGLEQPAAGSEHLARSIASLERALTVRTRERNVQGWALTNFNLARAHLLAAQRGDRAAVERARAAANNAIAGFEQAGSPRNAAASRAVLRDVEAVGGGASSNGAAK